MLVRINDRSGFPVFSGPPAYPAGSLRRELDRLFGSFERAPSFTPAALPAVTLSDSAEAFTLRAELPGVSEKDIEVDVAANLVTVKAVRKAEAPEGYATQRRERRSFSFERSYELATRVDPEKVHAALKQGVLTLTLPKVPEAQPKKITVTAA